jgi:hypothetical protein
MHGVNINTNHERGDEALASCWKFAHERRLHVAAAEQQAVMKLMK